MNIIKSKTHIILLLIVMATNLFFALPRIVNYSAVDEHLWTYGRTPRFWESIRKHDWRKTAVNDKPGITVAAISGIGLLFINPLDYEDILQKPKSPEQLEAIEKINFSFRFPVYIFALLMAPLFFILLRKLFNGTIAIFSVSIMYLSPIILGISIFVNPDSLLWAFSSLSIICFLLLQKTEKSAYAYASGVFLGLALLTKYVSTILYVYFFMLIFLNYIFSKLKYEPREYFKKASLDYLKVFFTSFATIFILFPATWIKFDKLLETTIFSRPFEPIWKVFAAFLLLLLVDTFVFKSYLFSSLLNFIKKFKRHILVAFFSIFLIAIAIVLLNTYGFIKKYDFEDLLLSPKGGGETKLSLTHSIRGTLVGIYVLLFEISPIVFLSFIFAIFSSLKKEFFNKKSTLAIFFLLVFILLYYLGSAVSDTASNVRYQISICPIASIIAALGLYRFMNLKKIKKFVLRKTFLSCVILIAILSISLFSIKPYFFSYASSFLPKNNILNMMDMGDGSFEATHYLNALPDAKNITIWTDKVASCELFIGKCYANLQPEIVADPDIDFFVVSSGRIYKATYFAGGRLSAEKAAYFRKIYSSDSGFEHKIEIDGRPNNFVKVVKNEIPSEK